MTKWGEPEQWFWNHVYLETDECIVWPYSCIPDGYGECRSLGLVHSKACEIHYGPRPKGMNALHGPCHNASCMNYRHLSWGTQSKNLQDRVRDGVIGERIYINNVEYTLTELSEMYDIPYGTLYWRIFSNRMLPEKAITMKKYERRNFKYKGEDLF